MHVLYHYSNTERFPVGVWWWNSEAESLSCYYDSLFYQERESVEDFLSLFIEELAWEEFVEAQLDRQAGIFHADILLEIEPKRYIQECERTRRQQALKIPLDSTRK